MQKRQSIVLFLFAGLFLVSGAAGLIYQIVWERLLALFFGVTMLSITLIVGAFMGGLGLGSFLGGRLAHKVKNTLLIYGLLELGVASFGIISQPLIFLIGESTAGIAYTWVFLLSFAILLVPTLLMGMTLPLLIQSFVHRAEGAGGVIGILYGINTLGAAFGAVLSGYVFIGKYGLDGTIYIAVAMNAIVGFFAIALSRWKEKIAEPPKPKAQPVALKTQWGYTTILLSSFLVGFIGLGFEMLWVRILHIVNKNTVYSFPSVLFVFLIGLALGGYIFGSAADRSKDPVLLFSKIELTGALLAALSFLIFWWSLDFSPPWIQGFFETQKPALPLVKVSHELIYSKRLLLHNLWEYLLPIIILVFPASVVLGGGLPVLDRIAINTPTLSGRKVGDIHLANIIGSVAGTLVISFLLLPTIGSERTLKLLSLLTLLFAAFYFFETPNKVNSRSLVGFGIALFLVVFSTPGKGQFYTDLYEKGTSFDAVISESGDSVLALTYVPNTDKQEGGLWVGGEAHTFFPHGGVYEVNALACSGASQPENILVIGFGGGYNTLFYTSLPSVKNIDIVELIGDIAPFQYENQKTVQVALDDPKVTYYVNDGRRFLNQYPQKKYDLISIDPLRWHTIGHNNLYSEEAMRIYQEHLSSGGVLCAWFDETRIIPNTVARVFPFVDQLGIDLLIAGNSPIEHSKAYLDEASRRYKIRAEIINIENPSVNLTTDLTRLALVANQDDILKKARSENIPYLTDLKPLLEYYLFKVPSE